MGRDLKKYFLVSQVVFLLFTVVSFFIRHQGLSFLNASEYATAIQGWGIPHAPGYSLYVLLGKFFYLFTKEPFAAQFWVNILAAWVTCVFLFFTLAANLASALLAVLFLLSQGLFQQYILVPEVFTLNLALAAALVYCHQAFDEKLQLRYVFFIGLIYGLAVCHHHLMALMVTASAYLLIRGFRKSKWLAGTGLALGGFLLGLLPLLYFFYATYKDPPYTYFSVTNFSELLFVVLRQGYGTVKMTGTAAALEAWDILKVIFGEMFWNTFAVGLLGGLAALPFYWRSRRGAPVAAILSAVTLGLFVIGSCLFANFTVESLDGKMAFVPYLSLPCFLLIYPLSYGWERVRQRFGRKVFVASGVLAGALIVYSLSRHNYRHYETIEFQIVQAYTTLERVVPPQGDSEVDPLFRRCILFTVTDPLHFGGRYYNEFKAKNPCYFFSVATVITGQFQGRSELALVRKLLGADYVLAGKSREYILMDLFNRAMTAGYQVFSLYPGDLNFFKKPDMIVTPVGNILELKMPGTQVPLDQVSREYQTYLDSLKVLLDNLEKAPIQPKALSESGVQAPFANLGIYSQLVKPSPESRALVEDLQRRSRKFLDHVWR